MTERAARPITDPTLRREFQSLPLRAAGAAPGALRWFVDDSLVAVSSTGETARWPLERGAHRIRVRDASGATAHARVVVR